MKSLSKSYLLFTLLLTCTLLLDQWTKMLVTTSSNLPITLIDTFLGIQNFARITLHHNTGIAFSIPIPQVAIFILILAVLFFGLKFLAKEINLRHPVSQISLGLILGGTLGNLLDRIRFGYVVDFIAIWKFAVFNIADAAIFVGLATLMVAHSKLKRR